MSPRSPRSLLFALLCIASPVLGARPNGPIYWRPSGAWASKLAALEMQASTVAEPIPIKDIPMTAQIGISSAVFLFGILLCCCDKSFFCCSPYQTLLDAWLGPHEEDAFQPEVAVFDPHHHLWDFAEQPKVPMSQTMLRFLMRLRPGLRTWFLSDAKLAQTFGNRTPLANRYMENELLKDIKGNGKGHTVNGTIYMECGWVDKTAGSHALEPVGEAAMATEVNKRCPEICQGIVAFADLSLGADVEPALQEYAKNEKVKGIRFALAWSPDENIMDGTHAKKGIANTPEFRQGFALLSKYGLSYDCWLYHEQIEDLTALAAEFPETTVICDHNALPLGVRGYDKDKVFSEWQGLMRKLAQESNVMVKLSGLPMKVCGFGADELDKPANSDELARLYAPYITFVIETFGVDRCMFASNFPVDKIAGSYTTLFNAYKKIVKDYSAEDKQKLFELNTKKVYRM